MCKGLSSIVHLTVIIGLLMLNLALSTDISQASQGTPQVMRSMSTTPMAFTQNIGQWPDSILFRASSGGATMWFTSDGIYYQYTRRIAGDSNSLQTMEQTDMSQKPRGINTSDSVETMLIKVAFVGANANPAVTAEGQLDYKCNYFFGNDPSGWRTDVPNYSAIVMKNIYPGINVRFSGDENNQAGYEFVAAPGADLGQIQIAYEGVEGTSLDTDGRLTVRTKWGNMLAAMQTPVNIKGPVAGKLTLMAENAIDLEGVSAGRANSNSDSVQLAYSTHLGGDWTQSGYGIAVNTDGNAYVTGLVYSTNFPLQNPLQPEHRGKEDVFVTKFSSAGNSLVYSTYLGGANVDVAYGIAVDGIGNAYITGFTASIDFPTVNPIQGNHGGDEVFIAKISSAGDSLVYSTYLGGSDNDYGQAIAVDPTGGAFVTGFIYSSDFPLENPFQTDQNGLDAFAARLSINGDDLIYSTYLGGISNEEGYGIAVDKEGQAYVMGSTASNDFPTQNAYQEGQAGNEDVFVAKLSSEGNSLIYGTYLGGDNSDIGFAIAVDNKANAYVTGWTSSSDFPTRNPYQSEMNGGKDVFVTKLSVAGDSLVYSTYLGGNSSADWGYGIAVDSKGHAYVTGETGSPDFPTRNFFQTDQYEYDAFAAKFSETGSSLVYSTYLGGSSVDDGMGIAVDGEGNAYVAGSTASSDFPVQNAYQATLQSNGGGYDVYVTKLAAYDDADGDGFNDDQDNCPEILNPEQADADGDGVGNVCDNCPETPNPDQADTDSDGQGDVCDFICGDVNGDEIVNLKDATDMIKYLYKGYPAPFFLFAGNVNGDELINLKDITYLVKYLYKGGPPPFCGTVTDIDDNTYQAVQIGTQWWMMENLKVTHYRNGDDIPNITDDLAWSGQSTGAYCDYNNNADLGMIYGKLYNWYAVNDSRNIAPRGWHVPTDAEWQTLIDYLGDHAVAGGKMKETGTTHWLSPNIGATNESGFSALPGGYRYHSGVFSSVGYYAYFWSSTEYNSDSAWYRYLCNGSLEVGRSYFNKPDGFSLRCVRDK